MPRKITQYALTEQPLAWGRALLCGAMGAIFMMLSIDIFNMMGITPFSFEIYIGSLLLYNPYSPQAWVLGFILNTLFGAIFGILYAYCFEFIYRRSSSRIGVGLGAWHAFIAAIAFFPFFNAIHEFMGIPLTTEMHHFGILGSGMGAATPLLLLMGHLFFGMCMGTFYGTVQIERVRERFFEPGETGLTPELGGIAPEEDPEDRIAV